MRPDVPVRSTAVRAPRPLLAAVLIAALVAALLAATPVVAQDDPPTDPPAPADTVEIIKTGSLPRNADVALEVVDVTFETADTILISRDDEFADALASGVMQHDAPLLLVPSSGPLPAEVVARIESLEATRAIVLGGVDAVAPAVADELVALGLDVERREGDTRVETALAIARADAPTADTIMLARAFPADGAADPSQAFADTLAAGGVAARLGYPILLTQTEVLTGATRDYLAEAAPDRVLVLGGTAAIGDAVADELAAMGVGVERIAGDSRDETAAAIAKVAGDETAADAARVIVTDGQGPDAWAAGFALASHAAAFDAPIVLTSGAVVPPSTRTFLEPGIGGDPAEAPVLTCAVVPDVCEEVRVSAQLPPRPARSVGPIAFDVAEGEALVEPYQARAGDLVTVAYDQLATSAAGTACIQLRLLDPDDVVVARLDNGFSNCTDQATRAAGPVVEVVQGGTLRLVVTGVDGPVSGRAYVRAVTPVEVAVDGPDVGVSLEVPGDVHRGRFAGSAGDVVSIGYDDLRSGAPDTACIELRLLDVQGRRLAALENGFSNCADRAVRAGLEAAVTLPEDGTYTLETRFTDGQFQHRPGSARVVLTSAPTVPITVGGGAVAVALDRPGQIHRATFEGAAGATVVLGYRDLVDGGFDGACIRMRLRAPNGNLLAGGITNGFTHCTDRETSGTADPIQLPQDGTYVVETLFTDTGSNFGDRPGRASIVVS